MNFSNNFFKSMSVCAVVGGILMIIYLLLSFGYTIPANLEEEIALQDNTAYTTAQWIHLALLLLFVATFWGVVGKKIDTAAGLATTGFIFCMIDLLPNMVFNSIQIFGFNYNWASKYAEATDEAVKAGLMAKMGFFYDASYAVMFLFFVGWLIGLFLFGLATWKGKGMEKVVSIFFFLVFLAELLMFIGFFGRIAWLGGLIMLFWIAVIALAILFFLVGAWLWQGKREAA